MARRALLPLLFLPLLLAVPSAGASAGEDEADDAAPVLRLVSIREGLLRSVVRGDLSRLPEAAIQKQAARVGVDLAEPPQSHVVHRFANARLFYVFYKVAEEAFGEQAWVLQRIKRTERNWDAPDDPEPEVKVTYQVEAFKLRDGALKRPDQHYGCYGIGNRHRREIVKEYEIGFGSVPGKAEGIDWPFDDGILFKVLARYGPSSEVYDRVAFTAATPWTLSVTLEADGDYRVAAPELGFAVPETPPPEEADAGEARPSGE